MWTRTNVSPKIKNKRIPRAKCNNTTLKKGNKWRETKSFNPLNLCLVSRRADLIANDAFEGKMKE